MLQYIMQTSPYANLTTEQYWLGYPHDALPALTKWYCKSAQLAALARLDWTVG